MFRAGIFIFVFCFYCSFKKKNKTTDDIWQRKQTVVTSAAILLFFWSPSSSRLLFLAASEGCSCQPAGPLAPSSFYPETPLVMTPPCSSQRAQRGGVQATIRQKSLPPLCFFFLSFFFVSFSPTFFFLQLRKPAFLFLLPAVKPGPLSPSPPPQSERREAARHMATQASVRVRVAHSENSPNTALQSSVLG